MNGGVSGPDDSAVFKRRGLGVENTPELRSRRRRCVAALLLTVPLGLVWRLAPLHLPPAASKYGGSALWATAVYWAVAAVLVRRPTGVVAVTAAAVALGVECLKQVYWAPLDRFRETLAGKLLLGRYFTYGAIAAYWIAIGVVAALDHAFERHRARGSG